MRSNPQDRPAKRLTRRLLSSEGESMEVNLSELSPGLPDHSVLKWALPNCFQCPSAHGHHILRLPCMDSKFTRTSVLIESLCSSKALLYDVASMDGITQVKTLRSLTKACAGGE